MICVLKLDCYTCILSINISNHLRLWIIKAATMQNAHVIKCCTLAITYKLCRRSVCCTFYLLNLYRSSVFITSSPSWSFRISIVHICIKTNLVVYILCNSLLVIIVLKSCDYKTSCRNIASVSIYSSSLIFLVNLITNLFKYNINCVTWLSYIRICLGPSTITSWHILECQTERECYSTICNESCCSSIFNFWLRNSNSIFYVLCELIKCNRFNICRLNNI